MQSRMYHKKLDEETILEKTAYEVSIAKIELASDDLDGTEETES
jgi:hypothetical protein